MPRWMIPQNIGSSPDCKSLPAKLGSSPNRKEARKPISGIVHFVKLNPFQWMWISDKLVYEQKV